MEFIEAIKSRHSEYDLSKNVTINDVALQSALQEVVKYTPSAFNSQSQRVVLLLRDQHDAFWDFLIEKMKEIVSGERYTKTKEKLTTFKDAYGTVLFYEDMAIIEKLQNKFPLYKENFAKWSLEQNGMLQSNTWVELRHLELGASLQHYNELVEDYLKDTYQLSDKWQLRAQMPFGHIESYAEEKPHEDLSKRFYVKK